MFEQRTDLALEAHELARKNKRRALDGVIYREEESEGFKLTRVEIINSNGEKETGKPCGKYLTLDLGRLWDMGTHDLELAVNAIKKLLLELSHDPSSVLVAGLGNSTVTADALGPAVLSHIIVTRHLKSESPDIYNALSFADISAIAPGVLSQTGIETFEIIDSMVKKLKPSLVIVIDALASRDISRLGTTVQLSDTGIAPGSGIGNKRVAINKNSLGVPVVSMGIPTVVDALTLTANVIEMCGMEPNKFARDRISECKNMFVTPKDSDKMISHMAKALGYAVNMAYHKSLSYDEMISVSS